MNYNHIHLLTTHHQPILTFYLSSQVIKHIFNVPTKLTDANFKK